MAIQIALHHKTQYRYDKAVSLGPQTVQLRPAPHSGTPILSYSLTVIPDRHVLTWQLDLYANHVARIFFPEKTSEFVVEVNLVAELVPFNPFAFILEPEVENFPFEYPSELARELQAFLSHEAAGPRLQEFIKKILREEKRGTIGFLVDLNHAVRDEIGYTTRLEHGIQSCEQTLELRSGSCRDSAWLLVQILRNLGIAARFVSGYLIQLATEDGGPEDPQNDSADLHAWAEAYLPGAGWIGMDATSGLFAGEGHIPLMCTPDASQAAPVGGTVEPAQVDFSHAMSIRRLNESPSMSRPFTDETWARMRQVAHHVDRDLATQDVRLTMGGEPTFVGIDEPESPQWNTDALGAMKFTRGLTLIERLQQKTAPGALLHYGQGKWYPGEPLPRWALSCYWRRDGVPVWENVDLIAHEGVAHEGGVANEEEARDVGASDALRFMEALTRRLQVSSENLLAAYNPSSESKEPAAESQEPAGYILPLRRRPSGSDAVGNGSQLSWSSQLWFPRPERLLLSAGDSPIGFRIPVEAMPWVAPDELEYEYEPAPFADRVKLPPHPGGRMDLFAKEPPADTLPALPSSAEDATVTIRPSLCVQARGGRMHVFMPFASELADYLELVAAVEDTCAYLHQPVWIEGYAPPSDPRLRSFSVTPDPGVLEVNLQPASNWDELEDVNALLFEEAGGNRLTAVKYAYDGTRIATGGGSHIVIGGATLADSPLLRRPDLLRSMVAFWQNHPCLSYLFSGMYVGPTSQYPRVDEARMDSLYELEVAFSQLPGRDCAPNVIDGLFRNLLVDVTGNSHRAEFCIDKLYPPEGLGLRLGLLELRAFEMAPHFRMGLLASLLVRALVCLFWKQPYEGSLIRWGPALHDRFLLPHFVRRDLTDVLNLLRHAGYNFEEEWFAAQLAFRFPVIGSVAVGGVELELRQALEPWNVLAEETVSGRTARSVDSSLERIQVTLRGFTPEARYAVACNGRRVPLSPVEPGLGVAAVRYRARRLSDSLHPTIPVHTPLHFDIIDRWHRWNDEVGRNDRNDQMACSIARCSYFAVPPGRPVYTARPVDEKEAEGRRRERFQQSSEKREMELPEEETNPIFPMTLDLRFPAPGHSVRAGGTEAIP